MITLKQLKRLNVISWIPIVNFFVVYVYMWDKLRRHKVFTKKQVFFSEICMIVLFLVYAVIRTWVLGDLYNMIPDRLFVLMAIADSWCGLILPVRIAYRNIKKAYERQNDKK